MVTAEFAVGPTLGRLIRRSSTEDRLDILVRSGISAFEAGDLEKALTEFEAALTIGPSEPVVLNDLASTLSILGRHSEAQELFERSLRLRPGSTDAYFNRGLDKARQALSQTEPRALYLSALDDFDKALSLDASNIKAASTRASVLTALDRLPEALQQIRNLPSPIDGNVRTLRAAITDELMQRMAKRGAIAWNGGKPKGSNPPIDVSPGVFVSSLVVEERA